MRTAPESPSLLSDRQAGDEAKGTRHRKDGDAAREEAFSDRDLTLRAATPTGAHFGGRREIERRQHGGIQSPAEGPNPDESYILAT